ncbi:MAG TPA: carbohydrate kinase [Gemmatimonadaceae bacterium]|nr:carbohydrate kinase [Gemmatimonadaceae bacterium]
MAAGEILCFGEVLWDALPAGLFLGGAPFNVACHLSAAGARVAMVSRVGVDRLGEEALRRAVSFGVATDLVQFDPELPTGFVRATVNDAGEARYEILAPAAWDAIEITDDLVRRAAQARCLVFGSLAQRQPQSRRTLERLWKSPGRMAFDVNLRPPFEDRDVVRRSLQRADVLKVSRGELAKLADWFGLARTERDAAATLAHRFECPVVCVTRGRDGAALWRDGEWHEHPGFEVDVRDTVGAGDAFLAVLLMGLLDGRDSATVLQNANLIGAYVVTQFGAVPVDQSETSAPHLAPPRAASPPTKRRPASGGRSRGRRPPKRGGR